MKKIITHSGVFHADDVFAIAVLRNIYPEHEIIRTRNLEVIKTADICVDVGGHYDPENNLFDHHQKSFQLARTNKIPYASFGLVWLKYGLKLVKSQRIFDRIDESLVSLVDAADCGKATYTGHAYTVSQIISNLNPSWIEKGDYNQEFLKAVDLANLFLQREIRRYEDEEYAQDLIRYGLTQRESLYILVLNEFCPWQQESCKDHNVFYVVFPDTIGEWKVQAVPTEPGSFTCRKLLPEQWAGLLDGDFAKVVGLEDVTFCHKDRFIAGAKTKESALQLAQMAMSDL